MKSLRWALAAVLALSTVPLTADAQNRRDRNKGKTPAASPAGDKARGMAEAPASWPPPACAARPQTPACLG
jgi:hypothetical protein